MIAPGTTAASQGLVGHQCMGTRGDGDAEPTSTEFSVFIGIDIDSVAWIIVCEVLAKCSELYLPFGSASPVPPETWP